MLTCPYNVGVTPSIYRLCTAPMMDWSDRHCRFYFRLLAPHARLYTEMVTTGALIHGDVERHLRFDASEHPLALQLGGSEPDELAQCARLAHAWGYDEVNLNCGCPSERVQRGAFGACLMREPALVADCVKAMRDASPLPVTVKHRLGLDREENYGFARDFVGTLAQAGCEVFIVHARNAVLKGLSPKDNREIPPLRHAEVYRLKRDFPHLTIVINGGIADVDAATQHLQSVDGVMLGRAAYHDSYVLAALHARLWGIAPAARSEVACAVAQYATRMIQEGEHMRAITRHILGLYHGLPRARRWRRMLSDASALAANDPSLILRACEAMAASPLDAVA